MRLSTRGQQRDSLTLFHEEIGQCQHDRVTAVQIISTQVMRAGDGQTPSSDHLHHPSHLRLPVAMHLPEQA